MCKKMTIEQWVKACKRIIDQGDCEGLKKVLRYWEDDERYMVVQYREEIVDYAAEIKNREILKTILEHGEFSGMRIHLLQLSVEEEDPELLEVALNYANPNSLIHINIDEPLKRAQRNHLDNYEEGTRYYVTAEPLGICALQGKVELGKILLEHGARPEGMIPADVMEKKAQYLRPFNYAKMEVHMRWEEDERILMERCNGLKRLPPWAYAMYCNDIEAAEFFLGLGEDRCSLELAMAVSMVSKREIIKLLQEKKPNLMASLEEKFILRRFWPEAVKQYFDQGREIPANAVELMGTYLFEEYDIQTDRRNPDVMGFREDDFVETLKYLLKHGYRLTKDDLERLTLCMVIFRSERLWGVLKGKIPQGMDVSAWIDFLPLEEQTWPFGKKLAENGIRFKCVLDQDFKCYETKHYMELNRLFKLVDFELRQPEVLDCMSASALFTRSKRAMALLWKKGLINKENLSQAVKLICELQLTELYEFCAELAGTTGGSEVRYEL